MLVVLRDGSLLRGVFILTKAHAEAQPRISPSSTALSSSPSAAPVRAASVLLHITSTQKTTNGNKEKHAVDWKRMHQSPSKGAGAKIQLLIVE